MLHELVHCVRGPHDSQFYALLDELTKECDELRRKGVGGTGAGFDAPSAGRLGGGGGANSLLPSIGRLSDHESGSGPADARRKLLEAAARAAEERRAKAANAGSALMPSGGRKLGSGGYGTLALSS